MADAFSIGSAIFRKSITQIVYNLPDAIKISGPLWIFIYVVTYVLGRSISTQSGVPELSPGFFLLMLLALISIVCGFCWVAILWHRFMLLNEGSDNLLGRWQGDRIWAYIKYMIFISLFLVLIVMLPYLMILSTIGATLEKQPVLLLLLGFTASVLFYYFTLRFGLVLPSVALDKPIAMGASFSETDDYKGPILVASILLAGVTTIAGFLIQKSGIDQYTLQLPTFFVNWFFTMTGISILTTIYGYIVEKRDLG